LVVLAGALGAAAGALAAGAAAGAAAAGVLVVALAASDLLPESPGFSP
jgi:hypothetical protein